MRRYRDDPEDAADDTPVEPYRDDPRSDDEDTLLPASTAESLNNVNMDDLRNPVKRRNWAWSPKITAKVPPQLIRVSDAVTTWVKGPQPPRIYRINPFFPRIQYAPVALLDRFLPKFFHRALLLALTLAIWLLTFSLIQWKSSFASEVRGHGSPAVLSCNAHYWNDDNGCGINGDQCRPFANASLAFRCPANCGTAQAYEPHVVGDHAIRFSNVVIGGPLDPAEPIKSSVYRGDSFICGAAIHAGFISDRSGGCGVLELVGEHDYFPGTKAHRIQSSGFDSYFPHTFRFKKGTAQQCKDLRIPVMIMSAIFTAAIGIFASSPAAFFWSSFIILFATTGLAVNPPYASNAYDLISIEAGRFLPACFAMAIMYKYAVKRSLTGMTAQFEKTVLWLLPAWIGAANNYTFEKIPIHRLTPHDVRAQPGGVISLIIIVLSIFSIALGQAWCFRVEGRMPRYLALYATMGGGLLLSLAIPHMNLRIHHYILALLFLPGTSFQTRPSLIYQGLLVGLFVNGIARWGWDPIIQTPGELFGDQNIGSLLPAIATPAIGALSNNITFKFGALPTGPDRAGRTYDGISVLVNDVERLRTYGDENDDWTDEAKEWTWNRYKDGLPEYFRFAYMMGSGTADYTKAGTWLANGTWIPMEEGAS